MRKVYVVRAVWDEEAGVFYSESDISGLHIEADNLEDFESVLFKVGPELILSNHFSADALKGPHPEDVIPALVFERGPKPERHVA